jgi:uncharacterized membrane protein
MNVRRQVLVSAATIGAMVAVAAGAYGRVPPIAVVRWDIGGDPAGFLNRDLALVIVPAIALVLTVVFALAPTVAPARARLDRSAGAWTAVWMAVLVNLLLSQILMVVANLGVRLDVPRVCSLFAAGVIFVIGNWLGKVRYNLVFGLRTPWTLADERVWDKTHRFAGRLMVLAAMALAGLDVALPAFPQSAPVLYAAMIACAGGPALAAVIYSALVTRQS